MALWQLVLAAVFSFAMASPIYNQFVVSTKVNGTCAEDGKECGEGYVCYRPAGFKTPNYCFPEGVDPSKDLSYLLRPDYQRYVMMGGLAAVLLLLFISIGLLLGRTRQVRGDIALLHSSLSVHRDPPPRRNEIHDPAHEAADYNEVAGYSGEVPPVQQLPSSSKNYSPQYQRTKNQLPSSSNYNYPPQFAPDHRTQLAYSLPPRVVYVNAPEEDEWSDDEAVLSPRQGSVRFARKATSFRAYNATPSIKPSLSRAGSMRAKRPLVVNAASVSTETDNMPPLPRPRSTRSINRSVYEGLHELPPMDNSGDGTVEGAVMDLINLHN